MEEQVVSSAAMPLPFMIIWFAIIVLMVASFWKVFVKAGLPGWHCLIPIYSLILLLKIAGKPAWWIILLFVPLLNFVILIMVSIKLAQNFGKSTGFGLGLLFLWFIFYPLLAFGDARYQPQ